MNDTVLDKAKLRLEAVEREADELRSFIRMYVKLSGPGAQARPEDCSKFARWMLPDKQRLDGSDEWFSTKEEIVSAARDVLRQVYPRPLVIGDLYQALIDRGIRINGQNRKGNLSAKLAHPKDLMFVRDEGWYFCPEEKEAPDGELGGNASEASATEPHAKGRKAVPGGSTW